MDDAAVGLSRGPADTVMAEYPSPWAQALDEALACDANSRREALAALAARHPGFIDVWAELVVVARDPVEAYAYARVGYHRGLDALRASGWRGTGYVRFAHPSNRGFLRSLDHLRRLAGELGESEEAQRCALFLRQLDPEWPPAATTWEPGS